MIATVVNNVLDVVLDIPKFVFSDFFVSVLLALSGGLFFWRLIKKIVF